MLLVDIGSMGKMRARQEGAAPATVVVCLVIVAALLDNHDSQQFAMAEDKLQSNHHVHQQLQQQAVQVPLLVDTKFWIRNTEFGEKSNWLNERKPCSLIERIQVNEPAVVSLGDPLDALGGPLESNMRELVMPSDGMLLIEETTQGDISEDSLFFRYLNQTGDCFDSGTLEPGDTQVFKFEPSSDEMSWFNSANWASSLYEDGDEISQWIPDSHSIPCTEDAVIFGTHDNYHMSYKLLTGDSTISSFKVNFRPSASMQDELSNVSLPSLRVSKLKIGKKSYNQQEFDELLNSNSYGDILFEIGDKFSALRSSYGGNYNDDVSSKFSPQLSSVILIDESSVREGDIVDVCLDEAGCFCGNEDANVMQLICSFNYPVPLDEQPCYDPIQVTGYCSTICATNLIMTIDPSKFSERFLTNLLMEIEGQNINNIFIGNRRVDHHKYEITFRLVPDEDTQIHYENFLGTEMELAELVRAKLENSAIKSFYGIKLIEMNSSVNWRRSNQFEVFWASIILLSPIFFFVVTRFDDIWLEKIIVDILSSPINFNPSNDRFHHARMNNEQTGCTNYLISNEIMPIIEKPVISDDGHEIALIELDSQPSPRNINICQDNTNEILDND